MVSILMKGIWDREFMASHSVSGRKCPTDTDLLIPTRTFSSNKTLDPDVETIFYHN